MCLSQSSRGTQALGTREVDLGESTSLKTRAGATGAHQHWKPAVEGEDVREGSLGVSYDIVSRIGRNSQGAGRVQSTQTKEAARTKAPKATESSWWNTGREKLRGEKKWLGEEGWVLVVPPKILWSSIWGLQGAIEGFKSQKRPDLVLERLLCLLHKEMDSVRARAGMERSVFQERGDEDPGHWWWWACGTNWLVSEEKKVKGDPSFLGWVMLGRMCQPQRQWTWDKRPDSCGAWCVWQSLKE